MAVYFVFRSHDGTPTEKHVKRFEYDTVLDWARAVWKRHDARKEAKRYADQLFGMDSEVFCSLFETDVDAAPAPPRTMADVQGWFNEMYCEEDSHGPHHLQALTEWADNQRAIYVFDDHYRKKKPGKTDFLLLDGWELPDGELVAPAPRLPPTKAVAYSGDGEGKLYLTGKYVDCKYHLEDLDRPEHIPGLRVPDLARYVLLYPDEDLLAFPLHKVHDGLLEVLKQPRGEDAGFRAAIRKHPDDLTSWSAYSDWLEERDLPPAGLYLLDRALRAENCAFEGQNRKPKLDLVKVTPHMAQVCKHEGCETKGRKDQLTATDSFAQFIFFDDLWAAAHPALARGILTFASRWDVLT
jgi:uncharacterized protein (TIGR02996 family)